MSNQLIDAQIVSAHVANNIKKNSKFTSIAKHNDEIKGKKGTILTKVQFAPTDGEAQELQKGDMINIIPISQTEVHVPIKHIATAGELYDIEDLSAVGEVVDEYKAQLSALLTNSVDKNVMEELGKTKLVYDVSTTSTLTTDVAVTAKAMFGDDVIEEDLYLFVTSAQYAQIEIADNNRLINKLDVTNNRHVKGIYGGVNIIVSDLLPVADGIITNYLVKKGAVEIGTKKDVTVEEQRDVLYQRTTFALTTLYYTHLQNANGVVAIKVAADEATLVGA